MARSQCFQCGKGYDSNNPDDIAGDGRCPPCKEFAKKVAFEIDIKMAEYRRKNPISPSRYKRFVDRLDASSSGRIIIPARELGISFEE